MCQAVNNISGYILSNFDVYMQNISYDEFFQAMFVPGHYIVLISWCKE